MIEIDSKQIGFGKKCFIAAEIGINHNGDINLAKKTILAAKEAGADAVKFQNYYTEDFILNEDLTYEYISQGQKIVESQYNMFKRYELNFEQLKELKDYCDLVNIIFFSTPTSIRGIHDLQQIGSSLLKNGSDFLVDLELIAEMAKTGLPTIISTGMATLAEIDDAVRAFENAGGKDLVILHCTSSYPTPPDDINIRKIPSLIHGFQYPVGFSDHTNDIIAAIGAVTLGACFIEKHFTIDKNLPGPDHGFSSNPKEFELLVRSIKYTEKSLGNSKIGPAKSEESGRNSFRLSCVAKKDLPCHHLLEREDIAFSRPANGLPPKYVQFLLGKKLKKQLKKAEIINTEMVE